MYNIHTRIYTYFCGTRSDRKLKAYINHLLSWIVYRALMKVAYQAVNAANYVLGFCFINVIVGG